MGPADKRPAPPAPPAAVPPKRKASGLVVVLAIVGVAFLLLLLVGGLVAWKVMSSPEGRAIVGMVGEVARITQKAQAAPGTKALRAAGCTQAMVMDLEDIARVAGRMDAAAPSADDSLFASMVVCAAGPFSTPPSCDEVARTYVRAAGRPAASFLVTVSQAGRSEPVCTAVYDTEGAKIGDGDGLREDVLAVPLPTDDEAPSGDDRSTGD